MATEAPSAASRFAMAAPMPREPPVTRATLPASVVESVAMRFAYDSAESAADVEGFTGDPGRTGGGQEDDRGGNILGHPNAAQRRAGFGLFAKIAFENPGGLGALGFDHARVDRIDPDFAGSKFLGQRTGYGIHGRLGCAINRPARDAPG